MEIENCKTANGAKRAVLLKNILHATWKEYYSVHYGE